MGELADGDHPSAHDVTSCRERWNVTDELLGGSNDEMMKWWNFTDELIGGSNDEMMKWWNFTDELLGGSNDEWWNDEISPMNF